MKDSPLQPEADGRVRCSAVLGDDFLLNFERGEQAHKRGCGRADNQFLRHQREYWDWDMGWCSADNPPPPR